MHGKILVNQLGYIPLLCLFVVSTENSVQFTVFRIGLLEIVGVFFSRFLRCHCDYITGFSATLSSSKLTIQIQFDPHYSISISWQGSFEVNFFFLSSSIFFKMYCWDNSSLVFPAIEWILKRKKKETCYKDKWLQLKYKKPKPYIFFLLKSACYKLQFIKLVGKK